MALNLFRVFSFSRRRYLQFNYDMYRRGRAKFERIIFQDEKPLGQLSRVASKNVLRLVIKKDDSEGLLLSNKLYTWPSHKFCTPNQLCEQIARSKS